MFVKKQKDTDSISLMHQQHGKEESNVQRPLGGSIILFNLIKGCLNSPAMVRKHNEKHIFTLI